MAEYYNVTVTKLSEIGLYIPLENYMVLAVVTVATVGLMILFFLGFLALGKRLDRYRLKYGFDKEIEAKDITSKNIADRLEKREKAFAKRILKD